MLGKPLGLNRHETSWSETAVQTLPESTTCPLSEEECGEELLKLRDHPVPFSLFQACHGSLHSREHRTDLKATSARSPRYLADADPQQIKAGTRHFGEGKLLLH